MAQSSILTRLRDSIGSNIGAEIVNETLEKAIKEARDRSQTNPGGPATTFYNPTDLFMGRDWVMKGSRSLSYDDLRGMARNPIIGAIIQTRINQVAAFCSPQRDSYDYGYKIVSTTGNQEANKKKATEIQEWIYNCGLPGYGEPLLETFARKFIKDALEIDQACAEVVFARNAQPAYLVAVDGGTIRKLRAALEHATPDSQDKPIYAQVVDDVIVAEYTADQMMFGVRNPSTAMSAAGYGTSELEVLVRTVTSILNTEKYNAGQIAAGGTQKGIFVVKGDVDQQQFDTFKRDFREAIRNAATFWRPPVIRIGKDGAVEWKALDQSNRDMEYAQLFDFLVKQACGVYQIDPSEINWTIGSTGASVNFESQAGNKQEFSQRRGLKPLLKFFANNITHSIIRHIDPTLKMEFVGLDNDRSADVDILKKESESYKTINEVRAERGLKKVKGGDIIANMHFMQSAGFAPPGSEPAPTSGKAAEEEDEGIDEDTEVDIEDDREPKVKAKDKDGKAKGEKGKTAL